MSKRGDERLGWLSVPPALVLVVAAGCGEPSLGPDAIARVGDRVLPYAELETRLRDQLEIDGAGLDSGVLSSLLDQLIEEEMLRQLAVERGLVGPDEGAGAALAALLADEPVEEPGETELVAYFKAHPDEFEIPERVSLRQILVEDRAAAERLVELLAGGADFTELARRESVDPAAAWGGYQGELTREDLPPEFVDAVFSLAPGQISEIVDAAYGFLLFRVDAREPAQVVPFAEGRELARQRLLAERTQAGLAKLVTEAAEQFSVAVFARNLPFNYEGSHETS